MQVNIVVESLIGMKNRTQENNSFAIMPYEGPPKKMTQEMRTPPCFLPQKELCKLREAELVRAGNRYALLEY